MKIFLKSNTFYLVVGTIFLKSQFLKFEIYLYQFSKTKIFWIIFGNFGYCDKWAERGSKRMQRSRISVLNLVTHYIQKRRGEPGLFSFQYNLLQNWYKFSRITWTRHKYPCSNIKGDIISFGLFLAISAIVTSEPSVDQKGCREAGSLCWNHES